MLLNYEKGHGEKAEKLKCVPHCKSHQLLIIPNYDTASDQLLHIEAIRCH